MTLATDTHATDTHAPARPAPSAAGEGRILDTLRADLAAVAARDPAALGPLETLACCYPGFLALAAHRLAHVLWRRGHGRSARWLARGARLVTGIDLDPVARIGAGAFMDRSRGLSTTTTAAPAATSAADRRLDRLRAIDTCHP